MATKTTKFITLSKLAKRKKKHIGTGDGGLISDKIINRRSSQSTTAKTSVARGTVLSNKQAQTTNEES